MKNIAIITGASSGIGKEFVRQIDGGYVGKVDEIWVIARNSEKLEALKGNTFSKLRVFSADLAIEDELSDFLTALKEENPRVQVLVNSAGWGKFSDVSNSSLAELENMVDVNVQALVEMCYQVLPYLVRGSKIINISSSAAFMPLPGSAVYAASKAFVLSFSRALNHELKDVDITVTAVCPTGVRTNFFNKAGNQSGVKNIVDSFGITDAFTVVREALEDAEQGKDLSIPTLSGWLMYYSSKLLPYQAMMAIQDYLKIIIQKKKTHLLLRRKGVLQ